MTKIVMRNAALIALLLATSPAHAGPCARAIASVQTQVDIAIENSAGSDGESLNALHGYQPTPRSLAASEGGDGELFVYALDALDRARAADRAADSATCDRELANAKAALRR